MLYRAIPSLVEYFLIDSESVFIEKFYKNEEGVWSLFEYKELSDLVHFTAIDYKISVEEIYSNAFK